MDKLIVLPPTAATSELHLGNLYSWVIADSYARAMRESGQKVRILEAWNCLSKKIEDSSKDSVSMDKVQDLSFQAIDKARMFFQKYALNFERQGISDLDRAYIDFVKKRYSDLKDDGVIRDDSIILPDLDSMRMISSKVKWAPYGSEKRLNGIYLSSSKIDVFRKGNIGVSYPQKEGYVFGQKFVQSHIFDYLKQQYELEAGFYGNDLLARWLCFVMGFTRDLPVKTVGLTGIIKDNDGKKISKYDSNTPRLEDIETHPDNVRLALLKQTFGKDFRYPVFEDENKFRNKINNTRRYLLEFVREGEYQIDLKGLEDEKNFIVAKLLNAQFGEAYRKFYSLVYNSISKDIIEPLKEKGTSKERAKQVVNLLDRLSDIFIPVTANESVQIKRREYLVKFD